MLVKTLANLAYKVLSFSAMGRCEKHPQGGLFLKFVSKGRKNLTHPKLCQHSIQDENLGPLLKILWKFLVNSIFSFFRFFMLD